MANDSVHREPIEYVKRKESPVSQIEQSVSRYPKRSRKAPVRYVDPNLRRLMLAGEDFDEVISMLNNEENKDKKKVLNADDVSECSEPSSVESEDIGSVASEDTEGNPGTEPDTEEECFDDEEEEYSDGDGGAFTDDEKKEDSLF